MIGEPALISGVAKEPVTFACPCCGAETEAKAPIEQLITITGGYVFTGIIERLVKAKGGWVSIESLMDHVFQLRNDLPEDMRASIYVTISTSGKKLNKYGWVISGAKNQGKGVTAHYRLQPVASQG